MGFFISKQKRSARRRAARARSAAAARMLIHHSNASLPVPTPVVAESRPELQPDLELAVEVEVDIKQEPLEAEQDEQRMLQQDEMEVDLLDPKDTCPAEEELDPFGQDGSQKLFQENEENQQDQIRCQFCLKQYRNGRGRGTITQSKVEFVLGLRDWGTQGTQRACCEGCRKMFELFYEFKRSCLVALERSAELLIGAGTKAKTGKKAKMVESKSERPTRSKTKDVQQTKGSDGLGLEEGSKQKSQETPSTDALPTQLKQYIEKPSFECEICMVKFSDRLMLTKHCLNHPTTSPNKTATKPTVSERSTDLTISGADSDISAPEPDLSTIPERSIDRPTSDADSDIPAPEPNSSTEDEQQRKSYCGHCRKWFETKANYVKHKPDCNKFRARPGVWFVCSMCPRKFHSQENLTLHINRHNGVRTIPCQREGCTKMFFTMRHRLRHERICGQDAQWICSVCGTLFRSETGLRRHLAIHEAPKLSCDLCDKAFYTKDVLKKHAATHSEERKFQCKVCGKRFKSYEANRVHQRIHTQEKPYACHICDQRFMYNCLLKTHLEKGHEPEEPV